MSFSDDHARTARACFIVIALILSRYSAAQVRNNPAVPRATLTLEQIVSRLEEKNEERARTLSEFAGTRTYRLQYRGFPGGRDAEMLVEMNFRAPASKHFKIVAQTGSRFIITHVFMKLLQSEQEAIEEANRRHTALSRENYEFTLRGYEQDQGNSRYILGVTPKTKNKFLYQGQIWVDGTDFAVTHIEGEPAKNPSFWIKKTSIQHEYVKIGDFWFPAQNRTESQTRLGGTALLTIEYRDYRIISVAAKGILEGSRDCARLDCF